MLEVPAFLWFLVISHVLVNYIDWDKFIMLSGEPDERRKNSLEHPAQLKYSQHFRSQPAVEATGAESETIRRRTNRKRGGNGFQESLGAAESGTRSSPKGPAAVAFRTRCCIITCRTLPSRGGVPEVESLTTGACHYQAKPGFKSAAEGLSK